MARDYTQLQVDIAAWIVRTDLSSVIPSFIQLGEDEVSRVVRVLEQETDTTLTCTAPGYSAALPTGFLGFKHVFAVSGLPDTQYMPPQQFHELTRSPQTNLTGRSGVTNYTIEASKIKIAIAAGAADPVDLDVCYIERFEQLSPSNTSNWLLQNHYDIYLWASLKEAWDYIDEMEMVAKYQGKLDRAVGQLEKQEVKKRQPSGPLVSRPPEVVF